MPRELTTVPVPGGDLTVARWGRGDRAVVAVHGITANHRSWAPVAEELADEVTFLAPDLRGRGGSAALPGPYGMRQHADDCVAILDAFDLPAATFVGHSMGGFVVAQVAERYPGRLAGRLVLVDGGLPIPVPEGIPQEQLVAAIIGPAKQRLSMDWGSVEEYLDYWRPHPAVGEEWSDAVEAYLRYDVEQGADGRWRSTVVEAAVEFDGTEALRDPDAATALERIDHPTTFLWPPRGIMNQTPGLYPAELVEAWTQRLPHLESRFLDDLNHYTIALSARGGKLLAEEIRRAAAA